MVEQRDHSSHDVQASRNSSSRTFSMYLNPNGSDVKRDIELLSMCSAFSCSCQGLSAPEMSTTVHAGLPAIQYIHDQQYLG